MHLYPNTWMKLAGFCYRRAFGRGGDAEPAGIPGRRDPSYPCSGYAPRPATMGDFRDCMTDGHYLCDECAHREVPDPDDGD